MHAGCSLVWMSPTSNRASASNRAYSGRRRYPDIGISPIPRHFRGPISNTSRTCCWASGTPSRTHGTGVLVLDLVAARPRAGGSPSRSPRAGRAARSPVTTIGTRYVAAIGSYSVQPMIAHTWPAARNAWTWLPGESRSAVIAGGTRTCDTSTLKLSIPRRAHSATAIAFAGAVVSNPTAKNTTWRSGFASAIFTASSGEYTIRTSAPRALSASRSVVDPGTRSMSPYEREDHVRAARRSRAPCRPARAASRTPGSRDRGSSARRPGAPRRSPA